MTSHHDDHDDDHAGDQLVERDGPPPFNADDRATADHALAGGKGSRVPAAHTPGKAHTPPETIRPRLVVEAQPTSWTSITVSLDNVARSILSDNLRRDGAVIVNRGTTTVRIAPRPEGVNTGFRLSPGGSIELRNTQAVWGVAVDATGAPAVGTTGEVDVASEYR